MKLTAPWMETVSGRRVSLVDPDPESLHIEDIAWHLSQICRFNGATRKYYTVAEHAVRVSKWCTCPLHGLLHDAHEAYYGDFIRPVQELTNESGQSIRELLKPYLERMDRAIFSRWFWPYQTEGRHVAGSWFEDALTSTKQWDEAALAVEKRDLLSAERWPGTAPPPKVTEDPATTVRIPLGLTLTGKPEFVAARCQGWPAGYARRHFLDRFHELTR